MECQLYLYVTMRIKLCHNYYNEKFKASVDLRKVAMLKLGKVGQIYKTPH